MSDVENDDKDEGEKSELLKELKSSRVSPISGTAPPREGQWKPGQSGNPGGRPKWKPVTAALQHLVDANVANALASKLIVDAGKGNVSAMSLLMDRLEGKVPQTVGGSTDVGPVKLVIEWEK